MICDAVKKCRKLHGVSQKAIAEHAGVSVQAMINYDKGDREYPLSVIIATADLCGVSIDELIGRTVQTKTVAETLGLTKMQATFLETYIEADEQTRADLEAGLMAATKLTQQAKENYIDADMSAQRKEASSNSKSGKMA